MLRNYLKIAFRNLWKNKAYGIINVLGLGLGISACLVIFLLTSFELSFENFRPNQERVYRVVSSFDHHTEIAKNSGISAPAPSLIKQEISGIEKLAAFQVFWTKVSVPQGRQKKTFPEPVWGKSKPDVIVCGPGYFDIFGQEWIIGSPQASLSQPNGVVLTESKMKKYFGDILPEAALGRQVIYQDSLFTNVTGIVRDLPANTDFRFNDFISFSSIESKSWSQAFNLNDWNNTNSGSQAWIVLAKGVSAEKVQAQFPAFLLRYLDLKNGWNKGRAFALQALSDVHFNQELPNDFSYSAHLPTLYILMGIAAFLLLMAAINFINLTTAQWVTRSKEIGVRKVMGSGRSHLIGQFLTETLLTTTLAVLVAMILVRPVLQLFASYIPDHFSFRFTDTPVLIFLVAVTLVTTLLSGLYPAWVASAYSPLHSLKNQIVSTGQSRNAWLRRVLIISQFTFSQVFILATILVASQSHYMLTKDMGFRKDALVYFSPDWRDDEAKLPVLVEKFRQMPEIEMISMGSPALRQGYSRTSRTYKNGKTVIQIETHQKHADANFIPMYGLKLLAGRNLVTSDTLREFVVNEAFVKAMGLAKPQDAVGKMLESHTDDGKSKQQLPIVGVIADYHFRSLHNAIEPLILKSEHTDGGITLKIQAQHLPEIGTLTKKIQKAYKAVYPQSEYVVELQFFDDTIANFYKSEQRMAQLLNTATIIAIFIACLGLFGLVAFTTQQRTKEVGIRKVLGATVNNIVVLLTKDFLKLVLVAIVIAGPIAYYFMHQWLQNFAYRIKIRWWIFAAAGIVALIVALLTISFQAIKAALANPVKSLRSE